MIALALAALCGCNAVVRGSPLSGRPQRGAGLYLSTGGAPAPYRTLGFAQIRGYGVAIAGFTEVGDAALDGTIKGALANAARQMGGDGVIHIEFIDENPQTTYERIAAAAQSAQAVGSGQGGVQTRDRYVTVTGEIIQFLEK